MKLTIEELEKILKDKLGGLYGFEAVVSGIIGEVESINDTK